MPKPNWTPIKIRLGDIRAWEQNPRMSTKAQAKRIIESEKKFNQVIPFILSPSNQLYDGHQRLVAWLTIYGADHVMDAMQSDRELTDEEHRELVISLHAGATGGWNWEILSGWKAEELKGWGMDTDTLAGWNNDALNLRTMLTEEIDAASAFGALPTEDRAPFQQMTFTLHDTQAEQVHEAIKIAKAQGEFVDSENENSNGNALARICETYITEHGNS